jgi:hypothetical protein
MAAGLMVVGSHGGGGGGGFHGGGSGFHTIYRASEKERKDTTGDVVEAHRLAKHSRTWQLSTCARLDSDAACGLSNITQSESN